MQLVAGWSDVDAIRLDQYLIDDLADAHFHVSRQQFGQHADVPRMLMRHDDKCDLLTRRHSIKEFAESFQPACGSTYPNDWKRTVDTGFLHNLRWDQVIWCHGNLLCLNWSDALFLCHNLSVHKGRRSRQVAEVWLIDLRL